MIINEYIEIKIYRQNKKYYQSLGFDNCKVGDSIVVHHMQLPYRSKIEIDVECDYCGKTKTIPFCDYYSTVIDGVIKKYACCKCSSIKTKESNMLVHGVESIMHLEESKHKLRQVMLDKYGVEHAMQIPSSLEKSKQTQLDKYGVDNINKLPSTKLKIIQTNLDKYGVEHYSQTQECKDKTIKTCQEKYGTDNPFQNKEFQEKQKQTVNEIYGVDNVFQNENIKNKSKNTMIKKYGFSNPMQVQVIKDDVIRKALVTKYKHGNIATSSQQKHIHDLIGGELNYPVSTLSLDIAFPEEQIYVEYNGGGHNLQVKLGKLSEKEFKIKEIRRYQYLKSLGWKQIEINSPNDCLPNDEELLSCVLEGINLLKTTNINHHTINLYKNNTSTAIC